MAKDKKKGGGRSGKPSAGYLDRIKALVGMTTGSVYGTTQEFEDEFRDSMDGIRGTIDGIKRRYGKVTGPDSIIEFFNAIYQNSENGRKDKTKRLVNLNDLVARDMNDGFVNDLFIADMPRVKIYENCQIIYDYIPPLAAALDTVRDNILSPDDFTKNLFNIFYRDRAVGDDAGGDRVIANIKSLIKIYKLEEKATAIITEALKKGDQFILVARLKDRLAEMLVSEDEPGGVLAEESPNPEYCEIISEDVGSVFGECGVTVDEKNMSDFFPLVENFEDCVIPQKPGVQTVQGRPPAKYDMEKVRNKIFAKIAKIMNENVEFRSGSSSIVREEMEVKTEFSKETVLSSYGRSQATQDGLKQIMAAASGKGPTPKIRLAPGESEPEEVKEGDLNHIMGSVVKFLPPEKVVKIESNEICYGYYYIEKDRQTEEIPNVTTYNYNLSSMTMDTRQFSDGPEKMSTLIGVFTRLIGKKLNKKLLAKHPEFKHIVYELLRERYIVDKKIRVTYLSPAEVVHFPVNKDPNKSIYGNSFFKKVLFMAKLYLAMLTNSFLSKVLRSQDRRVYYVEVGVDNDVEGVIQSFVRDIRSKQYRITDFQDLNNIINQPGKFTDFFIPVINGEKPIEIDTLSGMDTQIPDDFMEFLLKGALSGTGVPSAFASLGLEDIEFAKTISMLNGRFVRLIIVYQKDLAGPFSELIRKLYVNEFSSRKSCSGEPEEDVDVSSIVVQFPPPSSLNMTTMLEQMNNIKDISTFISDVYLQSEENEKVKSDFQLAVTKDLVSSLDWGKYDRMLKEIRITVKQKATVPEGEDEEEEEEEDFSSPAPEGGEEDDEEAPDEGEEEGGGEPAGLPKIPGM